MTQSNRRRSIVIASAVWLLTWVFTQGIFMSGILTRLPGGSSAVYAIATAWALLVAAVCLTVMATRRRALLPKSKQLWLYVIPAILLVFLPGHYDLALTLPVYLFMILVTVFWQDYLTFGLLQSRLMMLMSQNAAAILTAILFFVGHIVFFLGSPLDLQLLLILISGFVFAFSRRYTKALYVTNVIHLCFYLL